VAEVTDAVADGGRLAEYRRRRDFSRTGEPRGGVPDPGDEPVFVVQIHDASTLHFDFRLEAGGALKSWAVPKGPSADPHDKRLAMPTEDHPMEYRAFEGVIAEGEYGAGAVIVWDQGGYRNLSTDRSGREIPFTEALREGHASFRLYGGKLRGRYALTRFRGGGAEGTGGSGEREAWLLVKRDETRGKAPGGGKGRGAKGQGGRGRGAPADPYRARSALTGRTLGQVAAEGPDGSQDPHGSHSPRDPHGSHGSDGSHGSAGSPGPRRPRKSRGARGARRPEGAP
jgi:DNA ligase D-like protein (predicted 3'-phosphoesterase)